MYETVILGGGPAGTGIAGMGNAAWSAGCIARGAMAGEASFRGQQNSHWLYQHGLGEMIYNLQRHAQWAARQRASETSTPVLSFLRTRKGDHSETRSMAPASEVNPVAAAVRGS